MSNTDFRTDKRSSPKGVAGKLQEAGDDVKQRASDAFNATSDVAREKIEELSVAARETASQAADKVKEQVSSQQSAGADYAERFAGNIRDAAKAFEQDTPFAARTIEMAADYFEEAAEKMRNGSLNDMMGSVTSFARRQPAAFLGLSVLTGFAVVRFLKASSGSGSASSPGSKRTYGASPSYGGDAYSSPQSSGAQRSS